MSIKDKTSLKTDNNQLYDNAIGLTQEVTATNQKSVTNDQVDSFATLKDRIISVDVSVSPTALILDFSNNEQFILDLTTQAATKVFDVTSIIGIVSGQNNRIQVLKNFDQSITLTPASGPVISEANNSLQITGVGSPVSLFYHYLDDSVGSAGDESELEIFVDNVAGDDNNNGLTEGTAFKTDDRAYEFAEASSAPNITINRKRASTYTQTVSHTLTNKNLTFTDHGAGAIPILKTNGSLLNISGNVTIINTEIDGDTGNSYFNLIGALNFNFLSGIIVVDGASTFISSINTQLSFLINDATAVIQSTGGSTPVASIVVRASDVIGSPNSITGFSDNTTSSVLNVQDGLDPIIDITFQGQIIPLGFSSIVTLVEKGMEEGVWTLDNNDFEVGGIESINLLDETSISSTLDDIWIDSAGVEMITLGFGGTGIVQRFILTNGNISTLVEDVANFKDLTSFGITTPSSIHLKNDGSKLVVADRGTNKIYGLDIPTPFDLTSITGIASTFDPGVQASNKDTNPLGIWLSDDGLNMIMTGSQNLNVYQYTLGSAFDVTGANVTFKTEFNLGLPLFSTNIPIGVHLSFDGRTMYIWSRSLGRLVQYDLGEPHIVANAIETNVVVLSQDSDTASAGIHLNDVQNKMYIINQAPKVIEQYNFNGTRTYELKKLASSVADTSILTDPKYSIKGHVTNENSADEVSSVSTQRTATQTFITVQNGAGLRKDFSIQIYKNT